MKQRRDITLGEMQDECKTRDSCRFINGVVSECKYKALCRDTMCKLEESCDGSEYDVIVDPCHWDLSDPPRFNEAQMALLKALRGLGFVSIENIGGGFKTTSEDGKTGLFMELLGVNYGEKLDLAELLGKDGAHAQT